MVGAGYETLLTADYSQIELRIMADLSGDQALASAFSSGHDFHAETASRVFGVAPEEVTVELRSKIKAMNYGLAYGLSDYGLSQQLRVSRDEARAFMDGYFEEFGGVRDYLEQVVAQARQDGYTQTILGRRRYLPDLVSDNRQRREMAERMALNAPIQGSAADIIKVAMLAVQGRIAVTRGCGPGCCSRSTTSCCSRWLPASLAGSRNWSTRPCAERSSSRCRSRCRWAPGAAGPRPLTRRAVGGPWSFRPITRLATASCLGPQIDRQGQALIS